MYRHRGLLDLLIRAAIDYARENGARIVEINPQPSSYTDQITDIFLQDVATVAMTRGEIKEDTAIGVVFAAFFALGVVLLSTVQTYSVDLTHILFGNVLGVSTRDLWFTAIFGGLVILTVLAFYKEFLVISFDPVLAVTLRLPTKLLRYLLLVLIAVTIVTALQVVGIALMLAMFVTPAATASLLTRRLPAMMAVAALIGAISGIAGLYASFHVNVASGAAVVLVASLIFLLAFLFAPGRGVIWRRA